MSPAHRVTKAQAKKPSGKLPTRFQPFRSVAPRPPRFRRFLDLPAELRNLIYKHHSEQAEAIDVCGVWNSPLKPDILALFETCHQIRDEASHEFFSTNTFCFLEQCDQWNGDNDDIELMPWYNWLNKIGKQNARSIRHVQLRIRDERNPEYYAKLIKELAIRCPGITRLAIVVEKHASAHKLSNARLVWMWEPNMVETLKGDRLEKLFPSIAMFKNLNVLMLAGRDSNDDRDCRTYRQCQLLDDLCTRFRVRLQLITSEDAKRDSGNCRLFWDMKKVYDGILVEPQDEPGRIIRTDDGAFGSRESQMTDTASQDDKNDDDDDDMDMDDWEDDSGVVV